CSTGPPAPSTPHSGHTIRPVMTTRHGDWSVATSPRIDVPTAYLDFPREIVRPPRSMAGWCPSIAWMNMYKAISEGTRCTLLMYDTRSSSGGSHGVHHMLLSSPAMHALWQA